MKEKIYNLLDKMLLLSGNDLAELEEKEVKLKDKLDNIKQEIKKLQEMDNPNKYVDVKSKELDMSSLALTINEESGLLIIVKNYKLELKEITEHNKLLINKKNKANMNVEKYKELLKNISYKLVDKQSSNEVFNSLQEENYVKLDFWNKELLSITKELENTENLENKIRTEKENFEYELSNIQRKIDVLKEKLSSDDNYINKELSNKDEEKLQNLKLEQRHLEIEIKKILTTPEYLAKDFKIYIDINDYISAHNKLSEIKVVVELIPYNTVNNFAILEQELKDIKKNKEIIKRKIAKNDYQNDLSIAYTERLKDANNLLNTNKQGIQDLQKEIKKIEQEASTLASNTKKLDIPKEIVAFYDEDLNYTIEYSLILKNTSLRYLESYQSKLKEEIENISYQIKNNKDLCDEESKMIDINKIKDIDEKILFLKNRLNNKLNIQEIKDDMDLLIASMEFDGTTEKIVVKEEVNDFLKVIKVEQINNENEEIIDLTGE